MEIRFLNIDITRKKLTPETAKAIFPFIRREIMKLNFQSIPTIDVREDEYIIVKMPEASFLKYCHVWAFLPVLEHYNGRPIQQSVVYGLLKSFIYIGNYDRLDEFDSINFPMMIESECICRFHNDLERIEVAKASPFLNLIFNKIYDSVHELNNKLSLDEHGF